MVLDYTYDEMIDLTKNFYDTLEINIPQKYIKRAVASLTMAEYAKCFNDKTNSEIYDHRALATVGDAVCGAYRMINKYKDESTMSSLTGEKFILQNDQLNITGKRLLEGKLFAYNNDLKDGNIKDYATAFEAVIGFISLLDIKKAFKVLDKNLV